MSQLPGGWAVLGAGGLLGAAVVARSRAMGVEPITLTRADFDFASEIDWAALAGRLEGLSTVVNCVAYSQVDRAEVEPELAQLINAELPGRLAEICARSGARLIHISTNFIFDGRLRRPYRTTDTPAPLQQYGLTKLRGEQAVLAAAGVGAQAAIVRTGWLYGAAGDLPSRLAARLTAGESVTLSAHRGAPTLAADLAEYIWRLGGLPEREFAGVHHGIASGSVSWYEFGREIARGLGVSDELVQLGEFEGVGRARRPANGLLQPTAVAGWQIPDWANGWQRYAPEFARAWGR